MDANNKYIENKQNFVLDLHEICKKFEKFKEGEIDIIKEEEFGICFLILHNPSKKNSFTGSMMVKLKNILNDLNNWSEGKALIIYGANYSLCSGSDLDTVKNILNKSDGYEMSKLMQYNLNLLQNLKLITLCLVHGSAIGGGAELLTACDFRLAVRSAKIGFVHKKLGITTGWSGGVRLVNLIGKTKALDLMLFGRQIDAEEALKCGLVNDILEDNKDFSIILLNAKKWLMKYIDGPTDTIKAIKSIVNAASTLPMQDALEVELNLFTSVWGNEPHKKALKENIKHR